ncbi:MAG TPA: GNAT family N-acetyltransferase [Microlunatus sp.]|nr:GNAT family N-acetyltransferase [Microlunatus sp.]
MRTSDELTVRPLEHADAEASRRLGFEAFGMPTTPPAEPASLELPGRTFHGVFSGQRLIARLADRAYDSWFGGVPVPTSGIAGVTVAMEDRGRGALSPLFAAALAAARERGAAVSGLFPSAARIYRSFGYELVGDYRTVRVATSELATVPAPARVATRRAVVDDLPAVRDLYDRWAAAQNGALTRRGTSFPHSDTELLEDFDGITVAEDTDGRLVGYASWDRGQHYDDRGTLEVSDLLASSADGYRALLQALGSFSAVTPTTKIDTSGDDVARLFLPGRRWETVASDPYMIAVIDVPAALGRRGYPWFLSARLGFRVAGDRVAGIDGAYRLEVAEGVAGCVAEEHDDDRTFAPRGLALLYAGVQSCANLRWAGLLSGGRLEQDAVWDTLFGGRQFHIRDYY